MTLFRTPPRRRRQRTAAQLEAENAKLRNALKQIEITTSAAHIANVREKFKNENREYDNPFAYIVGEVAAISRHSQ